MASKALFRGIAMFPTRVGYQWTYDRWDLWDLPTCRISRIGPISPIENLPLWGTKHKSKITVSFLAVPANFLANR